MSSGFEGLILRGDMQIDTAVSALIAANVTDKDVIHVLMSREVEFDDQDREKGSVIPHEERPPATVHIDGEEGARLRLSIIEGLEVIAKKKGHRGAVAALALLEVMREQ